MPRFRLNKMVVITLLSLLLMIPIGMIEDLIRERSHYREQAAESIAQSWTGAQQLFGPLLLIPYREPYSERSWNAEEKRYEELQRERKGYRLMSPKQLKIDGALKISQRYRGIYAIPVYAGNLSVSGLFSQEQLQQLFDAHPDYIWEPVQLTLGVTDLRGVVTQPQLEWGEQSHSFDSSSRIPGQKNGMHTTLAPLDELSNGDHPFSLSLTLRGMQSLTFTPTGQESAINLGANWPHPSFSGRSLPHTHRIDDTGFTASWLSSAFSSYLPRLLSECERGSCESLLEADTFGVTLISPVDIYQQGERAVKYALLFVALTFVAFYLFEIIKQLRLHPLHYLLVGFALALFFLLQISLSEHLGFTPAYTLAALACSALLSFYLGSVLGGRWRGLLFGVLLLGLYAVLYLILLSEDYALLLGSILLFASLALVMWLTRHIDWYALTEHNATSTPEPVASSAEQDSLTETTS